MNESFTPFAEDLAATAARQNQLHERAAATARGRFGTHVFVRAVVEISNYCRENCHYCGMRRDNRALQRYRGRWEDLAELLIHHRPASITDVNIQAGEDPVAVRTVALPLIQALRRETNLGISVCLGTLSHSLCDELRNTGATVYILKFETAQKSAYERFEAPGTMDERTEHIRWLAESGWKVSSGFIVGLPDQSAADLVQACELAASLPLSGCSVSPFIPGEDTPLTNAAIGSADVTLNCMAALRLMRPDWVIPAVSALNLAEPSSGYRRGLRTGANLVTMNLTPPDLRGNYLLYKRDRFIMTEERILDAIDAEGLSPSTQSLEDYYLTNGATVTSNGSSVLAATSVG